MSLRLVSLLAVVFAMMGCGRSAPTCVEVCGDIVLDGKALDEASVNFIDARTGAAACGGSVRGGRFEVKLPMGAYKVQVFASRPVPGQTVKDMGDAPVLKSIIPERYNSKTVLVADVRSSDPLAFQLRTR